MKSRFGYTGSVWRESVVRTNVRHVMGLSPNFLITRRTRFSFTLRPRRFSASEPPISVARKFLVNATLWHMPQFNVGQRVLIQRDDPSPFAGLPAIVEDVHANERGVATLDRYIVVFSWGEKQTFYEAQLQTLE